MPPIDRPKKTQGEIDQDNRIKENIRDLDWDHMTLQDFEDAFEDRDPFEFM